MTKITTKFILTSHIISVFLVVLSMFRNKWLKFYKILGTFSKFVKPTNKDDITTEFHIFKKWILAIQIRYLITDIITLYSLTYGDETGIIVAQTYITHHLLESIICFFMFRFNKINIFSRVCLVWFVLWFAALRKMGFRPFKIFKTLKLSA